MLVPIVFVLLTALGAHGQNEHAPSEVAFSVGLTHHMTVSSGQRVVYDNIFTNKASGYNPTTGAFTCPVSGLYVFQVHTLARNDSDMWLELHHNFQYVMSVWGHTDNDFAAAGNSAVIPLTKGDTVSVVSVDGYTSDLFGAPETIYCTFSGYLISPVFRDFPSIG